VTADRRHRAGGRRGAPPAHGAAPAQPVVRGVVRSHVETAVGLLRDHLADPRTLDSLANEVHLSRSQLVPTFDAVTSLGTMAYLRLMRAQQMARLLTHSDPPISAISREVGWADTNYASRCFHANNGISPT
jgi:transcriptional regulator GlxA family with amidase domain